MTAAELELACRALAKIASASVLLEAAATAVDDDSRDRLVAGAYALTLAARGELVSCVQAAELADAFAPSAPSLRIVR